MTGSLQVKNGKYYMVLNSTENGKRKQKWISTGLPEKGNKRKAEQMLREKLTEEEKRNPVVCRYDCGGLCSAMAYTYEAASR